MWGREGENSGLAMEERARRDNFELLQLASSPILGDGSANLRVSIGVEFSSYWNI